MRDEKIYQMQDSERKRFGMVYRQVMFLSSRHDAYEIVLSKPWARIRALFSNAWLRREVDSVQLRLVNEHDERVKQNAEMAKAEARKPKIVGLNGKVLVVLLIAFMPTSCVSISKHKRLQERYRIDMARITNEVNAKTERLRRFNQINEDGSLRSKKNDDSKGWDQNEGSHDEN